MRFLNILGISSIATTSTTPLPGSMISGLPVKQCTNPLGVRYEWRDLSDAKKKAFIDALKCLDSLPHASHLVPTGATPGSPPLNPNSSLYDDFVFAHVDANLKSHFTGLFLPWHRWFLHTFEKTLHDRCGFSDTVPFWDWSKDTENIPGSPVFNSSQTYGLGTFGSQKTNWEISDGVFGGVVRAYPKPHVARRAFNPTPFSHQVFPFNFLNANMLATDTFTPSVVEALVNGSIGNFTGFMQKIDGVRGQGMHNAVHLMMVGDLANLGVSPNDPIFWLHHANVDCIWARWQARHPQNQFAFGGGLTQDLENVDTYPTGASPPAVYTSELSTVGLSDPVKVQDVLATWNDYLCYKCAY